MKPLDPRLLKYAKAARTYIIEIAVLGVLTAGLVIAQAFLISAALSPVVGRSETLSDVKVPLLFLVGVVVVRAALIFVREARAHRAADQAIAELRSQVVQKAIRLGPRWRARNSAENTTLVTRGLDDLDPYFVKYLPQMLLAVTVTPLALIAILVLDFWSALIALIVVPLIPIFMVLIGRMTEGFSSKKLVAMERLGAQLLDLLTGLPTLRALGREKGPREHLIKLGKQNTRTTLATLRVAFLSGGVLEFLSTLSVALIAVQVGMRMVSGHLSLMVGLVIIMLAPEVFEPLRQLGTQFHASTNGIAAAKQCFQILETPEVPRGDLSPAPAGTTPIRIENLSVGSRGSWAPANLDGVILPGTITALAGASGTGKSTTVQVLLGFEPATRGRITVGLQDGSRAPVAEVDLASWWEGMAWVPQHPSISPGTVLENVADGARVPDSTLLEAAKATGFDRVVASLPDGWDTQIGLGGVGLSVGQRQRLALTRTLAQGPSLVVLDEPTAHLDAISEEQIISVLRGLRERGSTVIVIAHREAALSAADQVLNITSQAATEQERAQYPQLADDFELEDLSGELPGFLDTAYLPKDDLVGMRVVEEGAQK